MCTFIVVDLKNARIKLAHYFLREFSEINLYSADEGVTKVSLPKLYVPMTWTRYLKGRSFDPEDLSYADIWGKVCFLFNFCSYFDSIHTMY